LKTIKEASPARAEALRRLLRISRAELISDMNALAGTDYDRTHAYKWFTEGRTGPSVGLKIYLRMRLKHAWEQRRRIRACGPARREELVKRTSALLEACSTDVLLRFERRLSIFEDDLRRISK
jgi:hypothetical protein